MLAVKYKVQSATTSALSFSLLTYLHSSPPNNGRKIDCPINCNQFFRLSIVKSTFYMLTHSHQLQVAPPSNRPVVCACFRPKNHSAASRRQSSTTMLALVLILGAVASAQKDDFGFGGGAPRRPPPPPADKPKPLWFVPSGPATKENCNAEGEAVLAGNKAVFESPTSEIFVPEGAGTDICIFFAPPQPQEWQLGKGLSYNSKSCSEGCCFYTPASSKRVQEIEAEVEKNLPTWFRTPAGGCDDVPSSTTTSRLILNKNNNVSDSY